MAITAQQFEILLPMAVQWAAEQEANALRLGEPMNEVETAYAKRIGVLFPERVRLLKVQAMPHPSDPILRQAADETGLLGPQIAGLTLRYGIFVRQDWWRQLRLIVHELAHTHQYERLGGFSPFLRQYVWECLSEGYDHSGLELEARSIEQKVLNF